MVKVITLANAVAVVVGVGYALCRVLSLIAPSLLLSVAQSWFHTFNLTAGTAGSMSLGVFILGLVSSMAVSWIFTYAVAVLYDRLAK